MSLYGHGNIELKTLVLCTSVWNEICCWRYASYPSCEQHLLYCTSRQKKKNYSLIGIRKTDVSSRQKKKYDMKHSRDSFFYFSSTQVRQKN